MAARTLNLVRALGRASLTVSLQYRLEFLVEGGLALLWIASTLIPAIVLFGARTEVAGWSFPEMLVVLGWFVLLKAVLEGAVSPSLMQVVEHVRKGTLDFVLLKPADAQLLVSFAKVEPWKIVDLAGALLIFGYAFTKLGRVPGPLDVLLALALLLAAVLVLYSIAILVVAIAFVAVRVDNLLYLFQSVFDVARWPSSVFRGILSVLFTYVIPLALMTTYPSLALLSKITATTVVGALFGSLAFAYAARLIWSASIRRYTSASS